MRLIVSFLVVLLLAACGTGTNASPSGLSTPTASDTPAVSSAPSATPFVASVRVTFDGKNCLYSGPSVIPSPAVVTWAYAPTPSQEESAVFIFPVEHGTTAEDVATANADPRYYPGAGGETPPWLLNKGGAWMSYMGTGQADLPMQVYRLEGKVYDAYSITCHTNPGTADSVKYGSTLVQMEEG